MPSPAFVPADILIPHAELLPRWSAVACDQYTSEPEYWKKAYAFAGDAPSSLHIMLPEAYLGAPDADARIDAINGNMEKYLASGFFREYCSSFIYVRRTFASGKTRCGLVGAADLSQYDYRPGTEPAIRATEQTVLSRIPPRVKIRENAPLEMPHVLLLADDPEQSLFTMLEALSDALPVVYDFSLMLGGGSVTGRLVRGEAAEAVLAVLDKLGCGSMKIAVGDGNHSLASARSCWEALGCPENHPARYALCELVTLQDPGLEFEPIHRAVFGANAGNLLSYIREQNGRDFSAQYLTEAGCGDISFPANGNALACGALQTLLDRWCAENGGSVDYIHGEASARALAAQGAVSFILRAMNKSELFPAVAEHGTLPRKAFSMGEADEKRFYLECRRIRV